MSELTTAVAKKRVAEAIAVIEKSTSAEIVVMMRPDSGTYRHADFLAGGIGALLYLCAFLYHPDPFDFTYFPLEQAACFVLVALACSHLPWLRRPLSGRATRERNVTLAAKAMFVDRGITKTRSRTGVLVYLSAFERDAALVLDLGLDPKRLGDSLATAKAALREAARLGDADAFMKALQLLGACLAAEYPPEEGDVDELPNEVAA